MNLEPLTGAVESAAPGLLVTLESASVQTVFTTPQALDPLIEQITELIRSHVPDVTTAKGRKEIASLAFRVAKTKTYLDELGKDLVTKYKEMPKKIDANRLDMRTRLDALRDEARQPLDVWEAEQAAIEAKQKEEAAAAALALQVAHDYEFALLMDAEFDRTKEEAKRIAEQAQRDRENQIRHEAEERTRREAETRAKLEAEAFLRREIEAKLALERAESAKAEAEVRAEREKIEAEQRVRDAEARTIKEREDAQDRAEKERIASIEREEKARKEATELELRRQRVEKEQVEMDRAAREADRDHRKLFNRESLEDIRKALTESDTDPAVSILIAIAKSQIRHVSIAY